MKNIENIETLLVAGNQNNNIIVIDDFVCKLCSWGESIDELTEPQKFFYYNQNLEREINNGGFNQYFINSSGDFAHETILSLRAIGAETTAGILMSAIEPFPNAVVPKNRESRISVIEQIEDNAKPIWEELDGNFFEYKDDLNSLNLEFVRKHKNQF